jgi:hypothetical protein
MRIILWPDSEAVFAHGKREHRKLDRPREPRACAVAKRHKAKSGHSTGSHHRQNPASRTSYLARSVVISGTLLVWSQLRIDAPKPQTALLNSSMVWDVSAHVD